MKRVIGWGLDLVTGHQSFIVLLLLGAVAGGLWVRGERAIADRDRIVATADGICAAAGSNWIPPGAGIGKRGVACRAAVAGLAAFKARAIDSSNKILVDAAKRRAAKSEQDLQAAVDAANRTAAAARRMEDANAQVGPENRVDGAWFAALNQLAGLSP